jgi:hypothetical protein
MSHRRLAVALGLAVLAAACGDVGPSKNKVETFGGTLPPGGVRFHAYTLDGNGEVFLTLTSLSPPPLNGSIFLGLGQPTGQDCALIPGYNAAGIVNRKWEFGLLNKGTYCVLLYDPNVALPGPASYTGTFSHP